MDSATMIRIEIMIPVTPAVVVQLINLLREMLQEYHGYTISDCRPGSHVFMGAIGDKPATATRDDIALLLVDTDRRKDEVKRHMSDLKRRLELSYGQNLMWITMHPVERIL